MVKIWLLSVLTAGIILGRNIFEVSDIDRIAFNSSKGHIENRLTGRLAYNKLTFYTGRYLNNFFAGLDPNYFFFGGHPREIPGGDNRIKAPYFLLPFFIFGLWEQARNKDKRIGGVYLTTLGLVSFFAIDALWWALAPFWYLTIVYPLRGLWKK